MVRSLLSVTIFSCFASLATAQIDFRSLDNYANQAVPDYITLDDTPADNPITDEGATLGRVLFYDKRLSTHDNTACASCHQQDAAFTDPNVASVGTEGETTSRHSMRLVNNRFRRVEDTGMFWDKRAADQEDQATQPIKDHIEMGFSGQGGAPDFNDLITKLAAIPEYNALFSAAFGDDTITEDRIAKSLAQFVRSIQSFDSRYDQGRQQVNNFIQPFPNFTDEENAGKVLFLENDSQGGANCQVCHSMDNFELDATPTPGGNSGGNNGVITAIGGGTDTNNTRSPNLRDLVDANGVPHSGFMHDASMTTLTEVIEHYNDLAPVEGLDARLGGDQPGNPGAGQQLNLDATEIAQLEAFLKTLTGSDVYTNEKWSDPFDEDGNLALLGVLPGDYNGDGVVDAADYTLWRDTFGSTTDILADGDGDGQVDIDDFEIWKENYGAVLADLFADEVAGQSAAQATPEPSSLITLIIAGACALWVRAARAPRGAGRAPPWTGCGFT